MAESTKPIRSERKPIEQMDFKALRNEVQELRDMITMMQRRYEDLLYNLDEENFSSTLIRKNQNAMSKITVTAEEIRSEVKDLDKNLQSSITQTAEEIKLLTEADGGLQSQISQNANSIKSQAERINANETNISTVEQTAAGISAEVTEVKKNVSTNSTKITQNANAISAEVTARKNAVSALSSEIEQTAEGIRSTVSSVFKEITKVSSEGSMTDTSKIYSLNGVNYHYNDVVGEWEATEGNSIASSFIQTDDGFVLTGDVKITEIAQVGGDLKIGDLDSETQKMIRFNGSATVSTYLTFSGYDGLRVNSNGFQIASSPDKIVFTKPGASSFTAGSISLADYVSQYGGGNTVAVFA